MAIDVLDARAFAPVEVDLRGKLELLNRCFESQVKPENGYFGIREVAKDGGVTELIGKNEYGHTYKEYFKNGQIFKRRVNLGSHEEATIDFDDHGNDYMTTVKKLTDSSCKIVDIRLKPNTEIVKGNFTAVVDDLGRPVLNRLENVQARPSGEKRVWSSAGLKDDTYRLTDEAGHLIAYKYYGPGTRENVVPMNRSVNRKLFPKIDSIIDKELGPNHRVDCELKINYKGSDRRPSSFEPRIFVDGKEYTDLPANLRKIYNSDINDSSLLNIARRALVDTGERFNIGRNELGVSHRQGLESGAMAAKITLVVSTVDNVSAFVDGEIGADEMVLGIVGDTATAGFLAYGTSFVSTTVAQAMGRSSSALIQRVGGSCVPALAVSFGVQSYKDISDFAQGKINGGELAYNLGENAASIGGGFAGGALAGAAFGTVVGPAGTAVGGIVGGVVGCALASEAYATAVEAGAAGAEVLGSQVEQFANATVDAVAEQMPAKVEEVKGAFNSFFADNKLPFSV